MQQPRAILDAPSATPNNIGAAASKPRPGIILERRRRAPRWLRHAVVDSWRRESGSWRNSGPTGRRHGAWERGRGLLLIRHSAGTLPGFAERQQNLVQELE